MLLEILIIVLSPRAAAADVPRISGSPSDWPCRFWRIPRSNRRPPTTTTTNKRPSTRSWPKTRWPRSGTAAVAWAASQWTWSGGGFCPRRCGDGDGGRCGWSVVDCCCDGCVAAAVAAGCAAVVSVDGCGDGGDGDCRDVSVHPWRSSAAGTPCDAVRNRCRLRFRRRRYWRSGRGLNIRSRIRNHRTPWWSGCPTTWPAWRRSCHAGTSTTTATWPSAVVTRPTADPQPSGRRPSTACQYSATSCTRLGCSQSGCFGRVGCRHHRLPLQLMYFGTSSRPTRTDRSPDWSNRGYRWYW